MSTPSTAPTFSEIENARRRWAAAGHTVTRAAIDIHEVNPDDPFGEPCWRIDDASTMLSTRDLIAQAPAAPAAGRTALAADVPQRINAQTFMSKSDLYASRLPLADLRLDGGTQPRVAMDQTAINDYAEAIRAGAKLPPVTVFDDGQYLWLADGFHRYAAAKLAAQEHVWADIKRGTQRDAVLYAVGTNATHGLRRTSADKRRAIERLLLDPEWRQWSDAEIARRCAVDPKTVAAVRAEVTATMEIPESTHRRGRDGRLINIAAIGGRNGVAQPAGAVTMEIPESDGLHDATPAELSALLDHINETAAIVYTDRAWMRDYVVSAGKTRGLRIAPAQAAEAIQQFIDDEAETQRQQRAAEIAQAAEPTVTANATPAPAMLPVWRLESLVGSWLAQTWPDTARHEPELFELKVRHDRSKNWNSLTATINGQPHNKGDLIQAINNVYNQINQRRIKAAREQQITVLEQRQSLANQIEAETIQPAAAVLADRLAASHPGAWRLVYSRIFGLDVAPESTAADIISEVAARWLRGHLNYNELHDSELVRSRIGALFSNYDLRAPWLDNGVAPLAVLEGQS